MPKSKPGCYVALCVSSSEMTADQIAAHLGLAASRSIVKDTPAGEDSPATHPYHLALFPARLNPSERMDVHIEHLVTVLEPLLPKLEAIQDRCKLVIHCTCVVRDDDRWELSPELLARMSRMGIAFCFALDQHNEEKMV